MLALIDALEADLLQLDQNTGSASHQVKNLLSALQARERELQEVLTGIDKALQNPPDDLHRPIIVNELSNEAQEIAGRVWIPGPVVVDGVTYTDGYSIKNPNSNSNGLDQIVDRVKMLIR